MSGFGENVHKPQILALNPQIKIFFKIPAVSLFLHYWPPTSCRVSEKTNERSLEIYKDEQMDRQTDKGDYYGLHRVNSENSTKFSYILPHAVTLLQPRGIVSLISILKLIKSLFVDDYTHNTYTLRCKIYNFDTLGKRAGL